MGATGNAGEFEKIFQTVTSVVFGRKLAGHQDYEAWLGKNVSGNEFGKSMLSGEQVYLPPFDFYREIKQNIVTNGEADGLGKERLSDAELEKLSLSNAGELLARLAATTPNTIYGENSNMEDCSFYCNSHNCLKSCGLNQSKCCLYSFWPRQSEYAIGCYYLFSSKFCIKCYNSENLTRCFELSDCNNCGDSLFCHNCENVHDSMFCFNAKNLRNAIGNVQVLPERYKEIKSRLLGEISAELEKTKSLKWDIFNIGRRREGLWYHRLTKR